MEHGTRVRLSEFALKQNIKWRYPHRLGTIIMKRVQHNGFVFVQWDGMKSLRTLDERFVEVDHAIHNHL